MERETKMPATAKTVAMATPNAPVSADAVEERGSFLLDTVLVDVVEPLSGAAADVVGVESGGMTSSLDGVVSNPNDVVVVSSSSVVVVGSTVVVVDVGSGSGGTWAWAKTAPANTSAKASSSTLTLRLRGTRP
jgi:hypothetical protein